MGVDKKNRETVRLKQEKIWLQDIGRILVAKFEDPELCKNLSHRDREVVLEATEKCGVPLSYALKCMSVPKSTFYYWKASRRLKGREKRKEKSL